MVVLRGQTGLVPGWTGVGSSVPRRRLQGSGSPQPVDAHRLREPASQVDTHPH